MFSLEPPRTAYDLNFRIAGIPVRVHPFFWLAALILGSGGFSRNGHQVDPDSGTKLLIWVVVMFVSILIHELGHSFAIRFFGQVPRIVLYMMGGLAITDSASGFQFGTPQRRTPRTQILISLAGPGAGFVLAAFVITLIYALGGEFRFDSSGLPFYDLTVAPETSRPMFYLIHYALNFNIFWGLVNLLPVFPLDGGQISREFFELSDPWHGMVRSLWLSVFTAIGVAILGLIAMDSIFMAILFGSLAASNYMTLRQIGGGGFGGRPW